VTDVDPPLAPAERSGAYARLSDEQCKRLHEASLAILERTGVRMQLPEAVDLLRRAGAAVDGDVVRIPEALVQRALSTTPGELVLHDRLGKPAITCAGHAVAFGPGSDCLNILDHRSGERRRATLSDAIEGITLADALPNIDFVMSMFLPSDVDGRIADRYQMEIMLGRSTKPIVLVAYEPEGMTDCLDMAAAVAGGYEPLRERPSVVGYINVTRALVANEESLRKLLFMSERGLPFIWAPVTSGGTTGPVTTAGNLALNNAGVLGGIVLAQLVREGTPVVVPGFGGDALDMRTVIDPYAAPDHHGSVPALAHWYGLPMFSLAGGSDSKVVDEQAAAEAALTLLADALSGGHLIHDSGYLESGLTGSLVQLAICDELIAWVRRAIAPIPIDEETLALDLIDRLGPDGSFLEADHTIRHYRERWYPDLIDRWGHDTWRARGGKSMAARAADRVDALLASHQPAQLEPASASAVRAIVERAERGLVAS
jgi:trimethylamine--corrinoid protein Co-methyltransferase